MYQLPIHRTPPLLVGIDPDLRASGVALWSRSERRLLLADTMSVPMLHEWLLGYGRDEVFIYLEAGYKNPTANYHEVKLPKGVEPGSKRAKDYVRKTREEMARRIGQNEGVGLTIKAFLEWHKFGFVEPAPRKKKWTPTQFTMITGLVTKDQEVIDACSYVVGL